MRQLYNGVFMDFSGVTDAAIACWLLNGISMLSPRDIIVMVNDPLFLHQLVHPGFQNGTEDITHVRPAVSCFLVGNTSEV